MGKEIVHVVRRNWDVDFYQDIISGDGFIITEPAIVSLDDSKKKSMYGAQSPLFGTSYEDEQAFIERYRCKCGEFKGKLFEGEVCPICGSPVEHRGNNVKITGWISLGNDSKCINPYYYQLLVKLIGKKVFPDIINCRQKVDTDGNSSIASVDESDKIPSSPYMGIGIEGFKDDFVNIITYFASVKKNKADELMELIQDYDRVFTSHIPIYSTMLRPQSFTSDTFYFNSIDKHINTLFKLSDEVKDCNPIEKPFILQRIQLRVNSMWDYNFDLISQKEGFIRDKLLGGSLNYSSRNVIIPQPNLRDNEVDLSYQTFRILFKYKIIFYLMQLNNMVLSRAYDKWKRSFKFDFQVYNVMEYILEKEHPKILINRNPTLNYYSMLLMDIRKVKKDPTDYCLSVPLSILPGLNADFDGDILNIIAIINPEVMKMFRKFNPIERMIISRDSGLLNELFALEKGQLIDLYYFATLDVEDDNDE